MTESETRWALGDDAEGLKERAYELPTTCPPSTHSPTRYGTTGLTCGFPSGIRTYSSSLSLRSLSPAQGTTR